MKSIDWENEPKWQSTSILKELDEHRLALEKYGFITKEESAKILRRITLALKKIRA